MAYVIGCLMAGVSFLLNKFLLKYLGVKAVLSCSPILEEVTKTLCSYYFAADILATHVIFGILEAVYDWVKRKSYKRGIVAVLLSVIGHTLFGSLTILIFNLSDSIFFGLFVGSCVHLIWNITWIRQAN